MYLMSSSGETDIENKLMDMGKGRREMARRIETVTWKLIILYVKYIGNGNLLYVSGNSNRGSVTI